jgi:hypothetical protein
MSRKLFSVDLPYGNRDLDEGRIPHEIRDEFETLKCPLADGAEVRKSGSRWLIVTGDERKPPYQIEIRKKPRSPSAQTYNVFDLLDRYYTCTPLHTMANPPAPVSRKKLSMTLAEGAAPQQMEMAVEEEATPAERDTLLRLYSEICASWRTLTDVRFKLLAALPTVSGAGLALLISKDASPAGEAKAARTVLAVLGFIVSVGLYLYERRNSELYDDLISRARRIESELGIATGQFLGRLKGLRKVLWLLPVQHDWAINLTYISVIVVWFLAAWFPWVPDLKWAIEQMR